MSVILNGLQFVKETTQTIGNTSPPFTLTLDGPVSGFEAIHPKVGTNNQSYFTLRHGDAWMRFLGTSLLSSQLQVDTVVGSSDGGNPLVLSAGVKTVYSSYDEFMVFPKPLADYWTPHAGIGKTTTFSERWGKWFQTGIVVHFWCRYNVSSIGNGDAFKILGLPIASANESNAFSSVTVGRANSLATNATSIRGIIWPNTTEIALTIRTTASASEGSGNIIGNGTDLYVSGSYLIA